jgi:stress response protein SCP2
MNTNRLSHRVTRRADYLNSGAPYFKNLPHPIASVKTDADGKFKLELPSSTDQVIVVASAARHVPTGERENYFWAVKVTPPATVTLSNDNLTDSGATDSALQTLPLLTSRPELVKGVLTKTPYEQDTADTLKDELRKLKSDADKLKHDLLVSTGTKSAN